MSQAVRVPSFDDLYEQVKDLAEGMTGEILEPGVLRTMSRPGKQHRWVARMCQRSLDSFDRRLGGTGWWIEVEAEIRLPGDRLAVPDLSGWRVERVLELPEESPITVVPDWCCELLSPTTARDDRSLKLPLYARSGIAWQWVVDPALQTVEVFETIDGRPTLAATARDADRATLPPFDGEIDLGPWWPPRAPTSP